MYAGQLFVFMNHGTHIINIANFCTLIPLAAFPLTTQGIGKARSRINHSMTKGHMEATSFSQMVLGSRPQE